MCSICCVLGEVGKGGAARLSVCLSARARAERVARARVGVGGGDGGGLYLSPSQLSANRPAQGDAGRRAVWLEREQALRGRERGRRVGAAPRLASTSPSFCSSSPSAGLKRPGRARPRLRLGVACSCSRTTEHKRGRAGRRRGRSLWMKGKLFRRPRALKTLVSVEFKGRGV
jgi:hypothetical protein